MVRQIWEYVGRIDYSLEYVGDSVLLKCSAKLVNDEYGSYVAGEEASWVAGEFPISDIGAVGRLLASVWREPKPNIVKDNGLVEYLGLPENTLMVLLKNGIFKVDDLIKMTSEEVLALNGIADKSLVKINRCLHRVGLRGLK
jgi:hypothetical protein